MIKLRSEIIKDYNKNGLDKWNSIVKKGKKWHLYNTSDIFKFCATKFENIMEAMFFVFYLICEHPKRIRTTYMEDPSSFFNKIFSKCVDFKIFSELVVYSILYIQGEIFIMHFDYMAENVEFGYMVPFFQFRGIDPDLPEFNICQSSVPCRNIYIKGLDAIKHSD